MELSKIPHEDFISNSINRAAAERILHKAIESCLNMGNRLLSIQQFEKPVQTPESYADIFVIMRNLNIIDLEFSERLVKMAKFRNRLVHLYWQLDPEEIYQILQENISDLKEFQTTVVEYLNKESL